MQVSHHICGSVQEGSRSAWSPNVFFVHEPICNFTIQQKLWLWFPKCLSVPIIFFPLEISFYRKSNSTIWSIVDQVLERLYGGQKMYDSGMKLNSVFRSNLIVFYSNILLLLETYHSQKSKNPFYGMLCIEISWLLSFCLLYLTV